MKKYIHDKNEVDVLHDMQRDQRRLSSAEQINSSSDYDLDSDQFEFVERKSVMDWDGFYTDYTLYYDVLNDRYVTVFGDRDLYRPEDGDFDAEFESEWEAHEWFDSYKGAEEDEEDF